MKNKNPQIHNLKLLRQITPEMRYDEKMPFAEWQRAAREKLCGLLGLPFERCDLALEIEYEAEAKAKALNAKEIRFTFQSEEGYFVPCHLLVPKNTTKSLPVAICLQGHTTGMHISLGRPHETDTELVEDDDFAVRALQEGYCVLVIEQRNFGECGGKPEPDCYNSAMTALLIGRTTIGERVWDVQRAIDVLEKHFPQVDSSYIICMGNSGGGTATFYAACIDERIKAVMPSCSICTYDDSIAAIFHCSCNFVPNIRRYFDMGDLGGLITPRKLVVVAGNEDDIFPVSGVKKSFESIKSTYENQNCGENCELVIGDGGHRFYADDAWPVLNKLIGAIY